MSDPVVPPVVDPSATDPADPVTDPVDPPDKDAEIEKWKALSRKNETQAKANAAAAKRLAEIEDANKTEQQKLTERAEIAEKALQAATAERMKTTVGAAKGLTLPQSMRLQGSTQDELEADAEAFLAELKTPPTAPSFQGGPRTPARSSTDPVQQFADILRGGSPT